MIEIGQDVQGLLPGIASLSWLSGDAVGVAETAEGTGQGKAIADDLKQAEGSLVAGDRLGGAAQIMMGVAEAVPGVGLTVVIAEFAVEFGGNMTVLSPELAA